MSPRQRPEEPESRGRWKHGAIPVVGLIGGIGSGKSRIAGLLATRGAIVIDADAVGHELLGDAKIRDRIVEQFGQSVVDRSDGDGGTLSRIDRRALGAIVFADPSARRALETILHPRMRCRFVETIDRQVHGGDGRLIVLDAAILLEAGWDDLCDRIVFVDAPRQERLRRVADSRGWSEQTLESRERSQWPLDEKRRHADWVITNDSDPDRLEQEVDRLISGLEEPTGPADRIEGPRLEPKAGSRNGSIPSRIILDTPSPLGRKS